MDLARRELPGRALPRKTFRRDSTLPSPSTDLPTRDVATRIVRPDTSDADELSRILNLANEVGQQLLSGVQRREEERDTSAAVLDFARDEQDDGRFAKSRAYRDAWQREGAKRLALNVGTELTEAVTERLNDADDPATLDDVRELAESIFRKHVTDEQGNRLDFGTPEAKAILGHSFRQLLEGIVPQAAEAIKKQTDERFLATWAHNRTHEFYRGAPIGAEVEVGPEPDTLAPLPSGSTPGIAVLGDEPELVAPPSGGYAAPRAAFDVEAALAAVPPGISKDDAKGALIQSLINEAKRSGDPAILASVEQSVGDDGAPTFTPHEVAKLIDARQKIEEKAEKRSEQARADRHEANADILLEAMVSDNAPTRDFIRKAMRADRVADNFGYSLINALEADARQELREFRAEARQARFEAEAEIDAEVASMVAARMTGMLDGATMADDQELFASGTLGTGKKAATRLRQLRAAATAGRKELESNPSFAHYGALIRKFYGTKPPQGASMVARARGGAGSYDPVAYAAMMSAYRKKVGEGLPPGEAYLSAVSTYGPRGARGVEEARQARIRVLQAKRLTEGR